MAANSSRNVALTAHVLIALERTAQALTGSVKTYGSTARHKVRVLTNYWRIIYGSFKGKK